MLELTSTVHHYIVTGSDQLMFRHAGSYEGDKTTRNQHSGGGHIKVYKNK